MNILHVIMIFVALSSARSKPTTESTHAILRRLGFDPVERSPYNHHSKRVALETNKARYHNDFYNSDTDSQMFVVKLPPHLPYYSPLKPEIFKNDNLTSPSVSFRSNGKPGRIYHWNIPVLKKMNHVTKNIRNFNEDSKVYRVKILSNHMQKLYNQQSSYKNNSKHKKQDKEKYAPQQMKHHRNKLYRFSDVTTNKKNLAKLEQNISDSQMENILLYDKKVNNIYDVQKSQNYSIRKLGHKHANEVSKVKNKSGGPNYYLPAIPKQNSFYKYFTGNGKPKSFYVIEKSKQPTRVHKLL